MYWNLGTFGLCFVLCCYLCHLKESISQYSNLTSDLGVCGRATSSASDFHSATAHVAWKDEQMSVPSCRKITRVGLIAKN